MGKWSGDTNHIRNDFPGPPDYVVKQPVAPPPGLYSPISWETMLQLKTVDSRTLESLNLTLFAEFVGGVCVGGVGLEILGPHCVSCKTDSKSQEKRAWVRYSLLSRNSSRWTTLMSPVLRGILRVWEIEVMSLVIVTKVFHFTLRKQSSRDLNEVSQSNRVETGIKFHLLLGHSPLSQLTSLLPGLPRLHFLSEKSQVGAQQNEMPVGKGDLHQGQDAGWKLCRARCILRTKPAGFLETKGQC